jgi:hypothetical protein
MTLLDSLRRLTKTSTRTRLVLALLVTASVGALAVACSARDDKSDSYEQALQQDGRDRLPMRLYVK